MVARKVIGMPAAEYFSHKADSRSFLCAVEKWGGPAQQWLDSGRSLFGGNSATRLGTKFDTLVMGLCEGKDVEGQLAIPPASVLSSNGARRGKAYDEWKASLSADVIDTTDDEAVTLKTMADHLLANPAARALVEQTTETQVSVFFDIDGHELKVRPDGCTPSIWWDLKSTSATWDRLYRSVVDYGYAQQEWLYVRGAMAVGLEHFRMPFVFYLPEQFVAEAGQRLIRVMEEVRLRRSTGVYMPADHGTITELEIPAWARQVEEVVEL
jgi:hypothetical protein